MLSKLERKAMLKLDLFVLPTATMLYFLSFLDRSNIGNSRVAGMQTDLGITDHEYQTAITMTYVPYILAELPSNLVLKKIGPNILLPTMVVLWGTVTVLQGTIFNYSGLLACRWFLGLFEGGLLPGLVLYLSYFYPRRMLQFRISIFFVATSLAGAFSGLLAAAIVNMDGLGGKKGWEWIFIVEGLFTFVFGIISFFIFPKSPGTCMVLNKEEKEAIIDLLERDGVGTESTTGRQETSFAWSDVLSAFYAPHVLILCVGMFASGTLLFGNSYFLPTVVSGLGYDFTPVEVQLMTVPPYAVSTVVSLTFAIISDRYGARGITLFISGLFAITGYAMFYGSTDPATLYGSVILQVTGAYLSAPSLSTWNSNNVAPHYRKATALAFGFVVTNSGGILSTWLFPGDERPRYRTGTIVNLTLAIVMTCSAVVNYTYLSSVNKHRENLARSTQEPPSTNDKVDSSKAEEGAITSTAVDHSIQDDRDVRYRYVL